jgi:hypothetical protein
MGIIPDGAQCHSVNKLYMSAYQFFKCFLGRFSGEALQKRHIINHGFYCLDVTDCVYPTENMLKLADLPVHSTCCRAQRREDKECK